MFVVDASYLIWSIQGAPDWDSEDRVRVEQAVARAGAVAPPHVVFEVGNALRKDWLIGKARDKVRVHETLLRGIELEPLPPQEFAAVHALADVHALTFYDAAYLHATMRADARTLLTQDWTLRAAAAKELG